MHLVNLTLLDPRNGDHQHLEGQFEEAEWQILQAYSEFTDELIETKLLKTGGSVSVSLSWTEASGQISATTELPPDDEIIVLLHRLRPFLLQKERTNFLSVCSLLGKRLNNRMVRGYLKQVREYYTGKELQGRFRMVINDDILLNSDQALDLWLNAYEYHRDPEKREKMQELSQMISFDGAKGILLNVLLAKVRAILMLSQLVNGIIRQGSVSIQIYPHYLDS